MTTGKASKRGATALFPLWLFAVSAASCRGASSAGSAPSASLASTRAAQEAFRPIKQRFNTATRAGRSVLEPRLRWFVASYPEDGQVPQARVDLALIAVERGDADAAERELAALRDSPSGSTRDLGELVSAALSLRAGEYARAHERLAPLTGKLIDPFARTLLDEQIVAASLGTERWYEAVAYMDLWLRDASEEDEEAVHEHVKNALERVPSEALELMMQTTLRGRASGRSGAAVRKAVVARLSSVAIEQQDTQLARRLVESAAGTEALGEASDALHELAESGGAAIAEGRTIGLLLSTGASHLASRAAAVLSGVIDALRADGTADGVRLITRDERDPQRTELALRSLASQGAVVLIAGLDELQAEVARAFAERTGVPVVTIASARSATEGARSTLGPGFTVGEPSDTASPALLEALVKSGARTCAVLGGGVPRAEPKLALSEPASCHAAAGKAGDPRFPVGAWRAARVDCLVVLGEASCAVDAIAEGARAGVTLRVVGLGLAGADLAAEPPEVPLRITGAGLFPLRRGEGASPLAAFARRQGKPVTWFAALGHDAAVLARAALRELPPTRTDAAAEVDQRHRALAVALAGARAALWTSRASGFAGAAALPRELEVREP